MLLRSLRASLRNVLRCSTVTAPTFATAATTSYRHAGRGALMPLCNNLGGGGAAAAARWQQPHRRTILSGAYEGDGQTTVQVLNQEYQHLLLVDGFSEHGFRLNNNMFVVGPIALFPRSLFQWNIRTAKDITPESLTLFLRLEPKLNILVIGYGDRDNRISKDVYTTCSKLGIGLEALPTYEASTTFNFLNTEYRCVAAALLPPRNIHLVDSN